MKQGITYILALSILLSSNLVSFGADTDADKSALSTEVITSRFESLNLGNVSFDAFQLAIIGHHYYKSQGLVTNDTVVIIDFDLPSTQQRMFVVDLSKNIVLHSSLVAHGKNTGQDLAKNFSNINGSLQSSLGFFKTNEKYIGKHGLSLRLDGLEKGINDHARSRAIVIHSADYVSREFIRVNHRLGRSFGCPALPVDGYQEAMDLLDDGVLLFIHSSNGNYKPTFVNK